MRMKKERAAEIMARLERFAAIQNKATDDAGWIALAYSCSYETAQRMIETARHLTSKPAVERVTPDGRIIYDANSVLNSDAARAHLDSLAIPEPKEPTP